MKIGAGVHAESKERPGKFYVSHDDVYLTIWSLVSGKLCHVT